MITGKVILENKPAVNVQIYESNLQGVPVKRNNKFTTTRTNAKGEYSINIPKSNTLSVTFKLVGTNGAIINADKVPLNLILTSNQTLPEFEITTPPKPPISEVKKFNYYWLLLFLIPIVYKMSKKK